ncbi:hypothetical protein DPMN_162929 [Dreissena polymorpha]|uniref:Uncharacterized protein n=1 Tax=Dreissena polymorpha TaxID=45954 RepID=A0A9D4ER68_DREPO|nr:hypothetical protein DPMN_162929 [Dreissena polymorpha]
MEAPVPSCFLVQEFRTEYVHFVNSVAPFITKMKGNVIGCAVCILFAIVYIEAATDQEFQALLIRFSVLEEKQAISDKRIGAIEKEIMSSEKRIADLEAYTALSERRVTMLKRENVRSNRRIDALEKKINQLYLKTIIALEKSLSDKTPSDKNIDTSEKIMRVHKKRIDTFENDINLPVNKNGHERS